MGLSKSYAVAVSRLPDLFQKIRDGQAPGLFSQQLLKDWGFKSSNDRVAIPLLKELGFLSPDGKPTTMYHEYRDHSRSKAVMAQALRNAYEDIFLIKAHPSESDRDAIKGKFKSFHNASDNLATLMTKTFMTLLKLSDLKATTPTKKITKDEEIKPIENNETITKEPIKESLSPNVPGLHYNIQIHLPATKDVEVYNAIFKSLKEHLFEN